MIALRRLEVLLPLGAGNLIDVGQQVVERAELLQQLGRRLDADAGHAGHVIHRVADQRLQVDHLLRRDAPVGQQFGPAELLALAQVVQADVFVDELAAILVAGAEVNVEAALATPPGASVASTSSASYSGG